MQGTGTGWCLYERRKKTQNVRWIATTNVVFFIQMKDAIILFNHCPYFPVPLCLWRYCWAVLSPSSPKDRLMSQAGARCMFGHPGKRQCGRPWCSGSCMQLSKEACIWLLHTARMGVRCEATRRHVCERMCFALGRVKLGSHSCTPGTVELQMRLLWLAAVPGTASWLARQESRQALKKQLCFRTWFLTSF